MAAGKEYPKKRLPQEAVPNVPGVNQSPRMRNNEPGQPPRITPKLPSLGEIIEGMTEAARQAPYESTRRTPREQGPLEAGYRFDFTNLDTGITVLDLSRLSLTQKEAARRIIEKRMPTDTIISIDEPNPIIKKDNK